MSKAAAQPATLYIKELCGIEAQSGDNLRLCPLGEVNGIDGRAFAIDGATVLANLKDNGLQIPLNVDHGFTDKYGSEAAGWFSDFSLGSDGIYAQLHFTKLGEELNQAQAYKYLSPEFLTDERHNVVQLIGVGFVNQPNLMNQALNHQAYASHDNQQHNQNNDQGENTMSDNTHEKADETTLQKEVNTLEAENKLLKEQVRLQKVDNAIFEGKLMPAKKEFALTLEANALDDFLKMEATAAPASKQEDNGIHPDAADDTDTGSDIYDQLGIG